MEATGSRWYFPIFEGLISAKHRERMGPAIWLYLWILSWAWVARDEGNLKYSHEQTAVELGCTSRTVKSWFKTLQEHGYIETRARNPYDLDVAVTNWRLIEEWLESKAAREVKKLSPLSHGREVKKLSRLDGDGPGEVKESSRLAERSEERSEGRSEDSFTPLISIRLLGYQYPASQGADAPDGDASSVCMADAFETLIQKLRVSPNKPAALRKIYRLCFGGSDEDLPEYGRLGKLASDVGGEGRLAQIMWELTTKRPTGDVCSYIQAGYGRKANNRRRDRSNGNGHNTEASANWGDGGDEQAMAAAVKRTRAALGLGEEEA